MADDLKAKVADMERRHTSNHKADVRYVQEHHPKLAQRLKEATEAFGRCEFEYRVSLRMTRRT